MRGAAPIGDPLQARFRLFEAMSGFWQRAAALQLLLLIPDDLHWADASSLRLLELLAPDLAARPVLALITYRKADLSRQHRLSGTLGELSRQRGFERVRLAGLNQDETAHDETGRWRRGLAVVGRGDPRADRGQSAVHRGNDAADPGRCAGHNRERLAPAARPYAATIRHALHKRPSKPAPPAR